MLWRTLCTITAPDHRDALAKAMLLLSPDLYDKPIRLELIERDGGRSSGTTTPWEVCGKLWRQVMISRATYRSAARPR